MKGMIEMTTATLVDETVLVDAPLQRSACELVEKVGDEHVTSVILEVGGRTLQVPQEVSDLMLRVLLHAAEGGAFSIRTMPEEVTTTVAADLLGVSRPTLMKLIAAGEITGRKVGSHTRLTSHDVLELADRRAAARAAAFDDLRRLSDQLGEED